MDTVYTHQCNKLTMCNYTEHCHNFHFLAGRIEACRNQAMIATMSVFACAQSDLQFLKIQFVAILTITKKIQLAALGSIKDRLTQTLKTKSCISLLCVCHKK